MSRSREIPLFLELKEWLDSVMLRGLNQLSMDDLIVLERIQSAARSFHMDTLVHLVDQQLNHIRHFLLHDGQREPVTALFFRLRAYLQMTDTIE